MWGHHYADCLPSVFAVRAGFDVDTSHIFPQGMLATVTLVGDVAGDGGARACAGRGMRWDFLSAQWPSPHCQG